VIKCYLSDDDDKKEVDVDGTPLSEEDSWTNAPLEERIKVLSSGRSTSNEFLSKLDDWKEEGEGAPGHRMRLKCWEEDNFYKYQLRFVNNFDPQLDPAEVDKLRFDILKLLGDKRERGLKHGGYIAAGPSKGGKGQSEPAKENSSDMQLDDGGGGRDDIFSDVDVDSVKPQASKEFSG